LDVGKMKKSELIDLLELAIARNKETANLLNGSDNPQVIQTKWRVVSETAAFEAVLDYCNGDATLLKMAANK
jgi:hypothetical protein